MRIENVNGRNLVCGHIYPSEEIEVGQHWAPADGGNHEYVISAIDEFDVHFTDIITGISYKKCIDGFQVRYCRIASHDQ